MPHKGYKQTPEQRANISKGLKDRKFSKVHKINLSKSSFWKGRPRQESIQLLENAHRKEKGTNNATRKLRLQIRKGKVRNSRHHKGAEISSSV